MAIKIARGNKTQTLTGEQFSVVSTGIAALDGTLTSDLSQLTLSGESLQAGDLHTFNSALSALEPVIESLTSMIPGADKLSVEMISAAQTSAAYGALLALDPGNTASREILQSQPKNSLHKVISSEGHARTDLAVECLDGNCGDHMITNTLLYNMGLCGYNGLIGNLYPLIVMDPSMAGFRVMAKLLYVHKGLTHDPSGSLANFKRTNLIKAYADHTVLESDGILAVPVWLSTNAAMFVDVATIPTQAREKNGEAFQTSYIKNGVEVNLIGISQTPNELARGVADITYALQRDVSVGNMLVSIGDDLIDFKLSGINSSRFTQAAQGEVYDMVLTMSTESVTIDANTMLVDGITPPTEAAITALTATNGAVMVNVELSGRVNIHTGKFRITSTAFRAAKVVDESGVVIPFTNALAGNIQTLLDTAVVEGFKPKAYMCPRNLSVECIQVLNDCYIEEHYIPHVCTLTTKRYINEGDQSDVDNLVHLSRVKMENAAATHLLTTVDELEDLYKAARLEDRPDVLGIGRLYVRPTWLKKTLDMSTVTSRRAGERREDIRAMMNDAIAEVASRLYTNSDMPAARCHLRSGDISKPTVTIITSMHIGSYISQTSQFAALTDAFNVRVITSPDRRFDSLDVGKIVITFSNYESDAADALDPLSWGACVNAPEVVYNINRPIGRAYVNELMVSPRYKFVAGLPVVAVITVSGLSYAALGNNDSTPW